MCGIAGGVLATFDDDKVLTHVLKYFAKYEEAFPDYKKKCHWIGMLKKVMMWPSMGMSLK